MGNIGEFYPFDSFWSKVLLDAGDLSQSAATSRGQYHFVNGADAFTLYVSAPGYRNEDLTVEVREGTLSIRGTPSTENSLGVLVPKKIDLHFSIHSTHLVDGAELKDGLLAVKLKKHQKTEIVKVPILSG